MDDKKKLEIEEIIKNSGNSFHSRVVQSLRYSKWTVLVSPYYSDNFTDKPREIDVVSEKKFGVKNMMERWLGTIGTRLFIECKYINTPTVFWFDKKDMERAIERMMADTGLEHPYKNENIKKHHYYFDIPVAKLFVSEKSRSEENEPINKAINQVLNATIYYRDKVNIIPESKKSGNQVFRRIAYPVIVVNSYENFFKTSMDSDNKDIEQITGLFQLEVNYAYLDKDRKEHNEYFLIDVVSISKLPEYLAMIENTDVALIVEHVKWQKDTEGTRNFSV